MKSPQEDQQKQNFMSWLMAALLLVMMLATFGYLAQRYRSQGNGALANRDFCVRSPLAIEFLSQSERAATDSRRLITSKKRPPSQPKPGRLGYLPVRATVPSTIAVATQISRARQEDMT